ncbi:MAG: phospholipid carrier-dependent glycosyltransferase [Chloroflexi bacterium]|nr:phospholipid carrier-dependent glycosyltransferase [Chloroflexota bacterium]
MKSIAYVAQNQRFQSILLIAVIFLSALGVRLRLRDAFEFDGLYGQDAFAYFEYGHEVRDAVHDFRAPGPMYWPLGFPILLAAGFAIGGENEQVAQGLVLVLSALIPVLIYGFMRDGLPLMRWSKKKARLAGMTSALILIFSGQLLQSSVVVMADVPALFWATLSLWALGRYFRKSDHKQRHGWIALAAFALAMATITRWLYGVLAVPYALSCLVWWRGQNKDRQILALPRRNSGKYWRDGVLAVVVGVLILLPQFLHSRSNPVSVIDHAWLRDWNIENAFKKDFVTPDGTFHYDEDVAQYYSEAAYDGWYLHPLFTVAMGVGLLTLLWRAWRNYAATTLFVLLVGWGIAAYGFLVGIPYQNVRFSLAYFLPLVVLAGIGVASVWVRLQQLSAVSTLKPISLATRGLVLLAVVVAAESPQSQAHDTVAWLVERKNEDYEAVQWAAGAIPASSTVYVLELWPMMRHYVPQVRTVEIYYETPTSMTQRLPQDRPAYLLLNMWAIQHQWVGKIPAQIYEALAEQPGLVRLGRYGNYHLFRVLE